MSQKAEVKLKYYIRYKKGKFVMENLKNQENIIDAEIVEDVQQKKTANSENAENVQNPETVHTCAKLRSSSPEIARETMRWAISEVKVQAVMDESDESGRTVMFLNAKDSQLARIKEYRNNLERANRGLTVINAAAGAVNGTVKFAANNILVPATQATTKIVVGAAGIAANAAITIGATVANNVLKTGMEIYNNASKDKEVAELKESTRQFAGLAKKWFKSRKVPNNDYIY
jgi:hypothetical protein